MPAKEVMKMDTVKEEKLNFVFSIMRFTYGLVPIVAGLDKFTNLLVDWKQYLSPIIANIIPASTFMPIVGVIEIIAGIIVLTKPRLGAYIVSAWLLGIAFNLLTTGNYFDVAVRDIVMSIGAFSLAKISEIVGEKTNAKVTPQAKARA
jgi:uncharacterized membrane protein YphA (DoxX/SURF4 family)